MLMVMTILMLMTMLMFLTIDHVEVEPAKREALVKVLCVLGEVEYLVNNLLNLRLGWIGF